ncbi:MAG: hypothetical protein A2937_03635 [Candidatus Yonathbacteria bacterium RIFCSPLOWO2_01_FULL_47_33b]|uniref:Uncharacterized protein n=1 Tax=Candidatus Yonathbacteria bacterium RIFCSPLOWO2_01_FULL_47_33b TaxID=1802727 RepID=A0A1G2SFG6_9BACT|nr:MAG: hypothetical protein A2937_03635 [Candidatus Yonathbacteria bacterium RIFCSPLOWO2_01_FULL_47_33b]
MSSPITPCEKNPALRKLIVEFAETLKHEAHKLGNHGLDEQNFYQSGLFRGAIERVRGQQAATMKYKRAFVATVLDYMKAKDAIADWKSAGEDNRHDYQVRLPNGRTAVIELKGCLDGNNTNIFDRPANANEFIVWSMCQNEGSDPRKGAWSGIHTRLSAEIIGRSQVVDGLVIWDILCGTVARPCPKLDRVKAMELGDYRLAPPCIYLFPSTVPSVRNNPAPPPQSLNDVGFLQALFDVFGGKDDELTSVYLEVNHKGAETVRRTRLVRNGIEIAASDDTPLHRA